MKDVTAKTVAAALVMIVVGQGVIASGWFGSRAEWWAGLTDDRPILNGRHPLHLYHAELGADTFAARWSTSCYDPAFQAGYPKTPVFDGGSRPAELVLYLSRPFPNLAPATAYKWGLFALALFVPAAFGIAAWGIQLSPSGIVAAAMLGSLLWWAGPVQTMVEAGASDILLAGLAGLVYLGGLARYSAEPGPAAWGVAAAAAVVGWYAQPVVWLGLLPIGIGHYIVAAPRHGFGWHFGRLGILAAGLLPNLWWLIHWGKFWWLRTPSIDDFTCLPCAINVVGELNDYPAMLGWNVAGWTITALGIPGCAILARTGKSAAAAGLCAAAVCAILLAKYGRAAPTLQAIHADRAVWFAVALFVLPAAGLIAEWWKRTPSEAGLMLAGAALPLILCFTGSSHAQPLLLGLSSEQRELVQALRTQTTNDARILWEEPDPGRPGWNWSALLPTLTGRTFLGGLDGAACIDHSFGGLRFGRLNGKLLRDWSAAGRTEFTERYNIGWVVTRTAASAAWWAADPTARELGRFTDGRDTVVLFRLDRTPSYFLRGGGTVERADCTKIVLTDVTPDDQGEVVLSFHHQPGLRLAPLFLRCEQDKDAEDPVPMLKLKLTGPISRIVLAWEP